MWNPLQKLKEKITGKPVEQPQEDVGKAKDAGMPGLPDMAQLEKTGKLGQFFRHWKNPAFLSQLKAMASRMQAEGVDIKDQKAVMAWVQAHEADIKAGKLGAAPAGEKQQTVVKTGPDIGRNDPCHCGSGKKFKKCHGA